VSTADARLSVGTWILALGGVGFAAGFFGPMVVNPGANQGPLVGLLFTGPGGAVAGLVLGVLFNLARVPGTVQKYVLRAACVLLGVGTLFYCLPEPARVADIIDATVAECAPPSEFANEALALWEPAVARTTWHSPAPNWKARALEHVERAPGVVLTMKVERMTTLYRHRKPWNSGKLFTSEWQRPSEPKRYYASDEGRTCSAYLARERQLYMPFTDSPANPSPAKEWPPTKVTSFLRLMELGPVPEVYRQYVRP
jgi:hypothetical protein